MPSGRLRIWPGKMEAGSMGMILGCCCLGLSSES